MHPRLTKVFYLKMTSFSNLLLKSFNVFSHILEVRSCRKEQRLLRCFLKNLCSPSKCSNCHTILPSDSQQLESFDLLADRSIGNISR